MLKVQNMKIAPFSTLGWLIENKYLPLIVKIFSRRKIASFASKKADFMLKIGIFRLID